jgi:hypothetical protein
MVARVLFARGACPATGEDRRARNLTRAAGQAKTECPLRPHNWRKADILQRRREVFDGLKIFHSASAPWPQELTSQLSEQSFSVLEIWRPEALSKAIINRRKDIERFGMLAVIHP